MAYRSSHKPCSLGEREWLTGQPVIPANRAEPDRIVMRAAFPERGQRSTVQFRNFSVQVL